MSSTDFKKLSREMSGRNSASNSVVLFSIAGFLGIALTWAAVTEIDNVTRGEGKIVSQMQNQLVQSAESGVVLRRNVLENDRVTAGQILFEIDPIEAQAEYDRMFQRLDTLKIKVARLEAEIAGTDFTPSTDIVGSSVQIGANELSLFEARKRELQGAITILEERRAQKETTLNSSRQSVETATNLLALIKDEIAVVEPLVRENIAPETRLLALKREREQAIGSLSDAEASVLAAQSSIQEITSEIANRKDTYLRQAMEELAQTVAERAELEKALPALSDRIERTVIAAPVDGIVNRLNFRTVGAFVKAGDAVLELVPTNDALKIETRIAPKDISNIKVDDLARIRLSAYDSARYGTLDGFVTNISPDATPVREGETQSFYIVDVAMSGDMVLNDGTAVSLLPGMTATVDVVSGKRTILEYFWSPVARIQELALRD
ncbi:MAG: HlyD family type I secretion periplasmic adaptor subunit [Nereida ignava]|uniref:HlyD family type I secretion periplasmic adaptor subunit n=1 Tax=Nereida ignava TaxID=282199 RepID=UPI0030F9997D